MSYAILQGLRSKGATGKNPPVGCVIVKNGLLLSIGRTGFNGRPHAEEEALNQIKNMWKKDRIFNPKMKQNFRKVLLNGWKLAIKKTLA